MNTNNVDDDAMPIPIPIPPPPPPPPTRRIDEKIDESKKEEKKKNLKDDDDDDVAPRTTAEDEDEDDQEEEEGSVSATAVDNTTTNKTTTETTTMNSASLLKTKTNTKSGIEDISHLVSKAHALICELRLLSRVVPDEWKNNRKSNNNSSNNKYKPILFDFKYLETPEKIEHSISKSATSRRLDAEFRRKYEKLLERYYLAFNAVTTWYKAFVKFTEDVEIGVYGSETIMRNLRLVKQMC